MTRQEMQSRRYNYRASKGLVPGQILMDAPVPSPQSATAAESARERMINRSVDKNDRDVSVIPNYTEAVQEQLNPLISEARNDTDSGAELARIAMEQLRGMGFDDDDFRAMGLISQDGEPLGRADSRQRRLDDIRSRLERSTSKSKRVNRFDKRSPQKSGAATARDRMIDRQQRGW